MGILNVYMGVLGVQRAFEGAKPTHNGPAQARLSQGAITEWAI